MLLCDVHAEIGCLKRNALSRCCMISFFTKLKFAATTSQDSSMLVLLDEENLLMSQNSNVQDEKEIEAPMELQIPTTPDGSPKCTEGDSSNGSKYHFETPALDAHRTNTVVNTETNSELMTKVSIRNIRQLAREEVLHGKGLERSRERLNDRNAYEMDDTPQRDLAVYSCNVFRTTAPSKDTSLSEFSPSQTPEKSSTESRSTSANCNVLRKAACTPQSGPSLQKKNSRRRISSEDSSDETDDESLGKTKEKRDKKRMNNRTKRRGYQSSEKYHTSEDIARLARSVNAKWERLWKRTAELATSMATSGDGVPVRTNKLTILAADEDNMVTLVPGGRFIRSCVARAAEAKWMRKRMNILVEDFWPLEQRCKLTLMKKKRNTECRTITKKEIDILTEAAKILEGTHPLHDKDINDSRAVRTWISAKIKSDRNRFSRIGNTSNKSRPGRSRSPDHSTSTDDSAETVEQGAAATITLENKHCSLEDLREVLTRSMYRAPKAETRIAPKDLHSWSSLAKRTNFTVAQLRILIPDTCAVTLNGKVRLVDYKFESLFMSAVYDFAMKTTEDWTIDANILQKQMANVPPELILHIMKKYMTPSTNTTRDSQLYRCDAAIMAKILLYEKVQTKKRWRYDELDQEFRASKYYAEKMNIVLYLADCAQITRDKETKDTVVVGNGRWSQFDSRRIISENYSRHFQQP